MGVIEEINIFQLSDCGKENNLQCRVFAKSARLKKTDALRRNVENIVAHTSRLHFCRRPLNHKEGANKAKD